MANVAFSHPHHSVHSPPVLGLGFRPTTSMNLPSLSVSHHNQSAYSHPSVLQHLASHISLGPPSQRSSQKRRLEDEEQDTSRGGRDIAMDRSPTPERRRATLPKRTRLAPPSSDKPGGTAKENKPEEQDVDVGVLLASLPTESLLPLLTSLVIAQPSIKPTLLSLIPRPSVDAAVQAIGQSARRLRDAYPYSAAPSLSTSPFGLGFGFNSRPTAFGSPIGLSSPPQFQPPDSSGRMRDEYVTSRLQPHIQEFVSTCLSYLRYFSALPDGLADTARSSPFTKERLVESFKFLEALMTHILSQPTLTRISLLPHLQPRVVDEWKAWVNHVDDLVNNQIVMFGQAEAEHWERALNEYAEEKDHGLDAMREVRDKWVAKVGWLAGPGRAPAQYMMQE